MAAEPSHATVSAGLIDRPLLLGHPSSDHQSVLRKTGVPESETLEVCFPNFATFPSELRERIWWLRWRTIRPLRKDLRFARNGREHHNGKYVSYQIPALLHTCQQSRAIGLKKYPSCFKEQLDMPVLFNLSKDLHLFTDDFRFLRFLQRLLSTFGPNDNGLPDELHFLGICGALDPQPGLYDSTQRRLHLFYNLEELILESCKSFPRGEWQATFVDNLKESWTDRREDAAEELKGSVLARERELPKISFLSSEEFKRLANAEPPTKL